MIIIVNLRFFINNKSNLTIIYKNDKHKCFRTFSYENLYEFAIGNYEDNIFEYTKNSLKEIEIYEVLFNEKIKKQLTEIIKLYFFRLEEIKNNKRIFTCLWRTKQSISSEYKAMSFYKLLLKELYKKHKDILEQLDLNEYYKKIKNL